MSKQEQKRCSYCKQVKPVEGFRVNYTRGYPNLRRYICPTCYERKMEFIQQTRKERDK